MSFVKLTVFVFTIVMITSPVTAQEQPAYLTDVEAKMTAVLNAAEVHLAASDLTLAAIESGPISDDTKNQLLRAHNKLADALELGASTIAKQSEVFNQEAITCMKEEPFSDSCQKTINILLAYQGWAIEALGALTKVSLGLLLSEKLLKDS